MAATMNTTTGIVYVRDLNGTLNLSSSAQIAGGAAIYAGSTGYLGISTRFVLRSPSDGIATLLNWAETGFTRLNFGGTSNSFPALKRNSTQLQCRLADDSNYTEFLAGAITSSAGTATPAGGGATAASYIGSAAVGFYIGTGAPTVSAAKGSIYTRTDATTTTTRFYINTDGATTWTNFTTAA